MNFSDNLKWSNMINTTGEIKVSYNAGASPFLIHSQLLSSLLPLYKP